MMTSGMGPRSGCLWMHPGAVDAAMAEAERTLALAAENIMRAVLAGRAPAR